MLRTLIMLNGENAENTQKTENAAVTLKNAENAENAKNAENAENTENAENAILSPSTSQAFSFLLVRSLTKHRSAAHIATLVSLLIFTVSCYAAIPEGAWFTAQHIKHLWHRGLPVHFSMINIKHPDQTLSSFIHGVSLIQLIFHTPSSYPCFNKYDAVLQFVESAEKSPKYSSSFPSLPPPFIRQVKIQQQAIADRKTQTTCIMYSANPI